MKVKTNLLPIGTVVKVKNYKNKVIIVKRNAIIEDKSFYDYGASLYPLGVYGGRMLYFQDYDIEKVYFKGYQDQRDLDYQNSLQQKYKNVDFKTLARKNWSWKDKLLTFLHIYR